MFDFILGALIGAVLGVFVAALCSAGEDGDGNVCHDRKQYRNH